MDKNIILPLATLFSLKQNNFFIEHKLSPVHLTWLHLVYGKILFQPRHPHLMVSEEIILYIILNFFEFVCAKYIKYNNYYEYITSLCLKADVIAKDVMAILPSDRCYGHFGLSG